MLHDMALALVDQYFCVSLQGEKYNWNACSIVSCLWAFTALLEIFWSCNGHVTWTQTVLCRLKGFPRKRSRRDTFQEAKENPQN